jgi:cyclophilin family peptidyl-prolyl cis-trans isomerase
MLAVVNKGSNSTVQRRKIMRIEKLLVTVVLATAVFFLIAHAHADKNEAAEGQPMVLLETTLGTIKIELWADKTPVTVENFLRYVDGGFYDGTIFHRVIKGFMIQGGGFSSDMKEKKTESPIENEASPQLKNDRGTISMARTNEIHSATSQFFINLVDNDFLNQRDKSPKGYGYAAFGEVVEGMDVVDKIGEVRTVTRAPYRDVPETPVVITKITRIAPTETK